MNIFIEMVVSVAVDCQSDRGQGKVYFFINFQGT